MLPERVVGSGEAALWRAVIDQALQDAAAIERIMPDGRPTFASLEGDRARYWFGRAGGDFAVACDGAGLDAKAMRDYAQDVIANGRRVPHKGGEPQISSMRWRSSAGTWSCSRTRPM